MATVPAPHDPDQHLAGSQFLITLGDNLEEQLEKKAAPFGYVVEGFDALEKINAAFVDHDGRPLKDIRILHTIVLDEADIQDPPGLVVPEASPLPTPAQLATERIKYDEEIDENADQEAVERLRREREARAQALTLEMVGDLPFAEVKPPENVLFVCKLNPVTQDSDLELIFSRFGKILSCEVIRDKRTGDSLQYAFIEFSEQKECENAYGKMEGVLIDDHRIHVDFSQSVSRLADVWRDSANKKRRTHGGGFGGIDSLEKKRQYRAERDREGGADGYGMVIDRKERDARGPGSRSGDRAHSPDGRAPRHRSRSRSPRRRRDGSRDGRHPRQRSRERPDEGRRRDRSPGRYHDDRRYRRDGRR
ncbi:hypothetical protein FH972_025158 [Carpinus fangiana]|uniref:Peptidyl-prolyl cis-trans isomerase n=1 Tax=Carpinus fangiana TaxID=176857 RepID=A0A5N6L0D1_9ROSI|nr:hypothetical protein FH972_025158 [Carpinus fangiana]